jgi:adenylyltransferase/sulfurtransferase
MYQRQQLFLGKSAQDKLFRSKVVLIGCGALGSNIGVSLARAGIGDIAVADRDIVEEENLGTHQYYYSDIGLPKAIALKEKMLAINKNAKIGAVVADVNRGNIESLVRGADLVMDGTDNFRTRFLINDACVKNRIAWVYGSCVRSGGASAVFHPSGPCFRCVFPKNPANFETCDTAGIISPLPPVIANIQVTEAIKALLNGYNGKEMIFYDAWKQTFDKISLKKASGCRTCSKHDYEFLKSRSRETTVLCGRNSVQVSPQHCLKIKDLLEKLQGSEVEIVGGNLYLLRFKVKNCVVTVFEDGRALINGTSDEKTAKSLYSRYVGA